MFYNILQYYCIERIFEFILYRQTYKLDEYMKKRSIKFVVLQLLIILPVLYGGVIELLQKFLFTSRSAEWGDWIADIAGSLTALLLAIICLRKRKKSINNISL